jgi:ATP-binding cassette subfamily C (CFTR/MRP) protein 4
VSISRIQKFLEFPERGDDDARLLKGQPKQTAEVTDGSAALSLSDVTCYWNAVNQSSEVTDTPRTLFLALSGISLDFLMKELTCVIGSVGSGKSALLQALVGELPTSSGTLIRRCKTLSYAAQDPWIMDGTVRENILMGTEWDSDWYDKVVNSTGLDIDFSQLRNGDETIVGDRGVQLSGGQRARIGLARALYLDADVLVCDDPLSAVDAKVGRLIFFEAIQGLAIARGKCVVLATHQHQYVSESRCVLMAGGRVECVGSYADCVKASGGRLTAHAPDTSVDNTDTPVIEASTAPDELAATEHRDKVSETNEAEDNKEMNVTGFVRLDTWVNYTRAMGGLWVGVGLLFLFSVTQATVLVTIGALGKWAERPAQDQKSWEILGLIIGLGCAVVILAIFRAMLCFYLTIRASRTLHDNMTKAVLRAKISFFDQNPLGRILNRFSADIGSNDDQLPTTLFDFTVTFFLVIGAIITACIVLPFILVAVPPLMWYFLKVRRIFVTSTRELKRLEGLARSPIYAMLSESLCGVATIRANHLMDYFKCKFEHAHDAHSRAFFAFIASSRWVGFRMDSIMFIFLALASFLSVLFSNQGWFNVDPAILGLALSMLLQLAGIFQWCIRQSAEVVNLMVSVERVLGFGALPPEAPLELDDDAALLQEGWPKEGSIDFHDLSVRYRPSLPLSLEKATFHVPSGTRVGVVGRTGSGKSTLVQSLFRLLEAEHGSITLDGIDIRNVGLHTLRTKMSVISQVPVLFSGCTVRENLDPFTAHSDETLKEALDDVHMISVIRDLPQGLNSMVAEGGSNFSVGQRQLLCLARAILNKNKVLVLDEPTANVDRRTDELLQEALHKSFEGATILSVAHRLDTVIDHDYILVLGQGHVLEFGSPADLLKKGEEDEEEGHFSSMVRDTGECMSRALRQRALGGRLCQKGAIRTKAAK